MSLYLHCFKWNNNLFLHKIASTLFLDQKQEAYIFCLWEQGGKCLHSLQNCLLVSSVEIATSISWWLSVPQKQEPV